MNRCTEPNLADSWARRGVSRLEITLEPPCRGNLDINFWNRIKESMKLCLRVVDIYPYADKNLNQPVFKSKVRQVETTDLAGARCDDSFTRVHKQLRYLVSSLMKRYPKIAA